MHRKQNNKESKTYVQGLRPFGNTLPRGVKGILKKNGFNYSEIISKWDLLVGKDISSVCHPKSIKMSKSSEKGTLLIYVKRGNEINIEYSKNEIIEKINSYFGFKLIKEVRLQTLNAERKKIRKNSLINLPEKIGIKINSIKSNEIKKSLTELIKIIKND